VGRASAHHLHTVACFGGWNAAEARQSALSSPGTLLPAFFQIAPHVRAYSEQPAIGSNHEHVWIAQIAGTPLLLRLPGVLEAAQINASATACPLPG